MKLLFKWSLIILTPLIALNSCRENGESSVSEINSINDDKSFFTQKIINSKFNRAYSNVFELQHENAILNVDGLDALNESNARTFATDRCSNYTDVLRCTGEKFERNFFGLEEATCYVGFMGCYFYRQLDCLLFEECMPFQ